MRDNAVRMCAKGSGRVSYIEWLACQIELTDNNGAQRHRVTRRAGGLRIWDEKVRYEAILIMVPDSDCLLNKIPSRIEFPAIQESLPLLPHDLSVRRAELELQPQLFPGRVLVFATSIHTDTALCLPPRKHA